jgi:hypothetical protein
MTFELLFNCVPFSPAMWEISINVFGMNFFSLSHWNILEEASIGALDGSISRF